MVEIPTERFERLVADALDAIPDALFELVDNVAVVVEERDPDHPELLGLYDGMPLTQRSNYGGLELPDRIVIYRQPICAMCDDDDEVTEEVLVTVVHEIAHYFGLDDAQLRELGWD